ncbi:MAG: sulfur carrier protein ThiS [Gloeomargarita sp. GMQP_bins_120]
MDNPTTFWLNGEAYPCRPQLSLAQVLQERGWHHKPVVIEYNGEILHRPFWTETLIQPGDRIEVVTIVGGG